jgi:osmotically-inducible protein OsmY
MKTDSQIQSDVLQELKWDPRVTHEHIGVAVSNGIVTLSGTVPTYFEKSAAEKAAQRVGGVTAVVEKIELKPAGSYKRDDQAIAMAILDQFKWHSQILEDRVHVKVEDGWVTLTGEFDWEYQRTAAEDAVRKLLGVKGISNDITIKPRVAEPVEIKAKIESALKRAVEREVNRLKVEVRGGEVVLSGKVRSFAELRDARGAAWSAPGVTAVNAKNLHIAAWQEGVNQPATTSR